MGDLGGLNMFNKLRQLFTRQNQFGKLQQPGQMKLFFFVFASLVIVGFYFYTLTVINRLRNDAQKVADTYASLYHVAISEILSEAEVNVIFSEVIKNSAIPMIVTDVKGNPTIWRNASWPSLLFDSPISSDDTSLKAKEALKKQVENFKKQNVPKVLRKAKTGELFGYLYYGHSQFLRHLDWMPFVEIAVILLFVAIGFIGLRNIQFSEKSNLWVALAKETAHQLGTPLSSLLGWIELIRTETQGLELPGAQKAKNQCDLIINEMESDVRRLNKITTRFSQIGSTPELKPNDVNAIVKEIVDYFQNRLPHLGKQIEIFSKLGWLPPVNLNRDLMEWVLENLTKNAADAITGRQGRIEIATEYIPEEKFVRILHTDNGKGMGRDEQFKIFEAGYTTKKRGWGLGLTLAKRIVENYHNGRIYVFHSEPGAGSTIAIELPVNINDS